MRDEPGLTRTRPRPARWRDSRAFAASGTVALAVGFAIFAYYASTLDAFPLETSVSTWVQSWSRPWLDTLMKVISAPGMLAIAGPLVLVASAALFLKGWRRDALMFLILAAAGRLIALGIKTAVARPRPSEDLIQLIQQSESYSFPSGHVTHYTIVLGLLAVLLEARLGPSKGLRILQAAFAVALLAMGLSRIYLGAHWLSDVAAGYVLGGACVLAAAWAWRRWAPGL